MNELNSRLLEYLPDPNTVKGGIGSVVETLQDEAPILVGEVLAWNFWITFLPFILGVVLTIAVPVFVIWFIRHYGTKWKEEDNCYVNEDKFSFFAFAFLAITIPVMCCNVDWLQIWIAPRLFLLEYIGGLLK